jgi:SAM-dependent methyltransferase
VVATDLDLTLLAPLASPVLSVLRHDIRKEELPSNVDLVHSRLLLEHLPDRETVLARMVRALRPGGWILLTDMDFRTVDFSKQDPSFDRIRSAFAAATHASGWDIQLGPNLASMLEKAGIIDVEAESWQTYDRRSVTSVLIARTYRRLRKQLIDHGAESGDIDRVYDLVVSGEVGVFSPTSWMAWGRRPEDT